MASSLPSPSSPIQTIIHDVPDSSTTINAETYSKIKTVLTSFQEKAKTAASNKETITQLQELKRKIQALEGRADNDLATWQKSVKSTFSLFASAVYNIRSGGKSSAQKIKDVCQEMQKTIEKQIEITTICQSDSPNPECKTKWDSFLNEIKLLKEGKTPQDPQLDAATIKTYLEKRKPLKELKDFKKSYEEALNASKSSGTDSQNTDLEKKLRQLNKLILDTENEIKTKEQNQESTEQTQTVDLKKILLEQKKRLSTFKEENIQFFQYKKVANLLKSGASFDEYNLVKEYIEARKARNEVIINKAQELLKEPIPLVTLASMITELKDNSDLKEAHENLLKGTLQRKTEQELQIFLEHMQTKDPIPDLTQKQKTSIKTCLEYITSTTKQTLLAKHAVVLLEISNQSTDPVTLFNPLELLTPIQNHFEERAEITPFMRKSVSNFLDGLSKKELTEQLGKEEITILLNLYKELKKRCGENISEKPKTLTSRINKLFEGGPSERHEDRNALYKKIQTFIKEQVTNFSKETEISLNDLSIALELSKSLNDPTLESKIETKIAPTIEKSLSTGVLSAEVKETIKTCLKSANEKTKDALYLTDKGKTLLENECITAYDFLKTAKGIESADSRIQSIAESVTWLLDNNKCGSEPEKKLLSEFNQKIKSNT